jgi:hypothetical protein
MNFWDVMHPSNSYHYVVQLVELPVHLLQHLQGTRVQASCAPARRRNVGAQLPQAMRWLLRLLMQLVGFPFILLCLAIQHGRPRVLLVQTPPAVPTLLVCWLMRLCLRCRVILDYHNIAYTIMRGQAERSGTGTPHLLKSDRFSVRHVFTLRSQV